MNDNEESNRQLRAELDALRESYEQYDLICRNANEGILLGDFETGRIRYANPAMCRMLGYAEEELKKLTVADIHPGSSLEYVLSQFKAQARGEITLAPDIPCLRENGTLLYADVKSVSVRMDGRECRIGFFSDITERKRAKDEIAQSRQFLDSIINGIADPIFVKDEKHRWIAFNESFCEMLGHAREEVLGKSDHDLFPKEQVDVFWAHDDMVMDSDQVDVNEEEITFGEQTRTISTSKSSFTNPITGERNLVGTIRDITEARRAAEELAKQHEQLLSIFDSMDEVVYVADPKTYELLSLNEPARRFWGDRVGEKCYQVLQDRDEPCPFCTNYRLFGDNLGKSHIWEFQNEVNDHWYRCIDRAIEWSDGRLVRCEMAFDITETKRLQELESRAARLETAGTIAGQVAHDFNNLLAPIMAYPEFIHEDLPRDSQAHAYLDSIENAARRIAEINQDLLTMGRRGHYSQSVLNLNRLVRHAVREMATPANTVTFETDLCEDLMNIKGGNAQIHRMLANLLVNARDAVQEIGCVTIKTENFYADDTSIAYGRVPRGEYVRLTVSDNGCGIPDDIIQRILDPFFSTKKTNKKRGSGLGLSVVDAVMKDHNGYIDLYTSVGHGTSFFLYFPVTRVGADESESETVADGTETILVVDDDDIQREVLSQLLARLGYKVSLVNSGERAVEFLRRNPQDLVILDMVMPEGIDGAETYRRILNVNGSQKAIIVSGFSESERVKAVQELGAGAFVRKPVSKKVLAAAVRTELDRQAAESAS